MVAGREKNIRNMWTLVINIAVIAAMVVTLALYASNNTREEEANSRNTLLRSTENVSDSVGLYFISQYRVLYNHHYYISPGGGNNLTYEEAVEYLRKANADATVNYQLLDPATYTGHSLLNGDTIKVDYHHDTYDSIRRACDIVAAGQVDYDIIRATSAFANSSDSAASSIALYTDILVDAGGQDKRYALLAAIRTENLVYSGLPSLPYENAGACIIDKNGDYIVKDDQSFRNSENFFKFLRVYNSLTYPQQADIQSELTRNETGILEYDNYRGEACYYTYHAISDTDGWYYISSVPVASTARSSFDYFFTLILLVFLGLLVAFNGWRMKYLNKLLRSNVRNLDEARKAADAANDAKTFFLAHMSHEMRTPLNAIIGMGALAQGKAQEPELESLLTKMSSASEHLLGIINDVLDISKIGQGKMVLHNEPFSIQEMTQVLATIYGISAGEKAISLVFNTDVAIDRYIIGDQLRLRQVITNLVSNAIKYNRQGGFVKVGISQVGEIAGDKARFLFQVEDNGFGISEEKQKDIFEPFSRDYTDNTKAIAGTGLGLAISSQLVQAMGGRIELESTLNKGSKFYFELEFPLGEVIVPQTDSSKPHWNSNTLSGLRILVAEDNEMNAFIVENLLRKAGAQVELAANGQEALELVENNQDGYFDIVLMDILMPVMDGYEATRRIRELGGDYGDKLPIAALSANAFYEDIERSLAQGMQAHLAKPIDVDLLYQTILDLTAFQ